MTLSINKINRKMLTRCIDHLRYENKVLKARLIECGKRIDEEQGGDDDNNTSINTPPSTPYTPSIRLSASGDNVFTTRGSEDSHTWWTGGVTCMVYCPQLDTFLVAGNGTINGANVRSGYFDTTTNKIVPDSADNCLKHGGFVGAAYGGGDIMLVGYASSQGGTAFTNNPGMSAYLTINKNNTWKWTIPAKNDGGLPLNKDWYAVAYGKKKFIAVASGANDTYKNNNDTALVDGKNDSATIAYSLDHKTWQFVDTPNGFYYAGIAFGNDKFIAVCTQRGSDSTISSIATSSDGITWDFKTNASTYSTTTWNSVAYNSKLNVFIAVQYEPYACTVIDANSFNKISDINASRIRMPYIWSTEEENPSFIYGSMDQSSDISNNGLGLIQGAISNNLNLSGVLNNNGLPITLAISSDGICLYSTGNAIIQLAGPSS